MVDHHTPIWAGQSGYRQHRRDRVGTHRLSQRRRSAGGRDRILCLQEREASSGADDGAPHPADGSRPGATVARLAIPHAFATNTELSAIKADTYHRAHARTELAIRDLKHHAGLSHCPSGNFTSSDTTPAATPAASVTSCSTGITTISSPPPPGFLVPPWLTTCTSRLAFLCHPGSQPVPVGGTPHPPGRTTNQRKTPSAPACSHCPQRIVNHGRKLILRLPTRWPWTDLYLTTLAGVRALPQLC